jgi:hypothetical protein
MQTKSRPAPTTPVRPSTDCPCGCAPCTQECCELECLIRPRFFCGQLLTDADLSALVDWSRAHFRLARQRHGWGVVCGLEVTCHSSNSAGVLIRPGYAIDCCGNAIVLCEPAKVDLAAACPKIDCFDPRRPPSKPKDAWRREAEALLEEAERLPVTTEVAAAPYEELENAVAGSDRDTIETAMKGLREALSAYMPAPILLATQLAGTRAVDLFLHYAEEGAAPQSAMRNGACNGGVCEDSRTREGYRVSWTLVDESAETGFNPADWLARNPRRRKEFNALLERLPKIEFAATRKHELEGFLAGRIGGSLCFLDEWIRAADDEQLAGPMLYQALYGLYVDDLFRTLAAGCASCDPATGVPIARVWLRGADAVHPCRVALIDAFPPHRRMIGPDVTRDAPVGWADMSDLVGMPWDRAAVELRIRGFEPQQKLHQIAAAETTMLAELIDATPFVPYLKGVAKALCVDLGGGMGTRLVGFVAPSA